MAPLLLNVVVYWQHFLSNLVVWWWHCLCQGTSEFVANEILICGGAAYARLLCSFGIGEAVVFLW